MGNREPHVGNTGYGTYYGTEERMGRARRKHPGKVKRLFLRPGDKVEFRFAMKRNGVDDFVSIFRSAEEVYFDLMGRLVIPGHEWPQKEEGKT
jgi:hypothetical protein